MSADEPVVRRYLCSELVTLNLAGESRVVNLEEIWRSGAILEAEDSAPAGVTAELKLGPVRLGVAIERVEKHAYGYRLELRFVDVAWTPELFTPAHLTDLASLAQTMRAPGTRFENPDKE